MAELPRFFLPAESLGTDTVCITGEALHHLAQVLRLQVGDRILLLDGAGLCCEAGLTSLTRRAAQAEITARWSVEETALPVRLLQGLPKGDKFDLVLQKGTELGITSFQPILSARAIQRPTDERLNKRARRWRKIVSEAARQSRRTILPHLEPLLPMAEALPGPPEHLALVLYERAETALAEVLPEARPEGVSLLIGPEGGFAAEEIELVLKAGYRPVHLGPRILRTETAGLAATTILQYRYGDLNRAPQPDKETP